MSHEHHESHFATYLAVFIALCIFTAMSVIADMVHLADKNVLRVIVLAIASAKALCVMLYFMHLKFERAWKYLLLLPTFILASAIPFALMPDIGLHYYTPESPQFHEYARQMAAEQAHAAQTGHGHDAAHAAEHAPATEPPAAPH